MKPDLSIVIVNFNTAAMTADCLQSIIDHQQNLKLEIILIDNASFDESLTLFKSKFGQKVKIVENQENIGFAAANNQGSKLAHSDNILFLNSDTLIIDNSLSKALSHLKEADLLTVKIKSKSGENQQAGGFGPNLFNLFLWAFFIDDLPNVHRIFKPYQISNLNFFNREQELDWVIGAFFLIKKSVFEKVGGFDENIFMYGEEMELCRRVKQSGFIIKYFPDCEIIHFGNGSSGGDRKNAIIGEFTALQYFFQKHGSKKVVGIVKLILKAAAGLRAVLFRMLKMPNFEVYEKIFYSL